jgi:hypothetical protein
MGKKRQGQILDDYVKTLKDDDVFFIGSASGWFFIGNKSSYEEMIDQISENYDKLFIRSDEYHTKKRAELLKDAENFKRKDEESDSEFADRMASLGKALATEINAQKTARMKRREFKPIRGREIKETYCKDVEAGIAIAIDGHESGGYWTTDEWNKANPKHKVLL